MKTENKVLPFIATHPGSLIQDEILFRKMSQKELALRMGVQKSFLNEMIKGKRAINADIALILEQILDISAEYWMNLQSQFELDQARLKQKTKDRLANAAAWGSISMGK